MPDSLDTETRPPRLTGPAPYLWRMLVFLLAVAAVIGLLHEGLARAFLANPPLNGLIAGVFVIGILHNIRQVARLKPDVAWFNRLGEPTPEAVAGTNPPRLLAPLAAMLGERKRRLSLSAPAMRSILDGIASRLDEQRDLSRYTIGLLVFLGLLGTFWGLSQTVGAVGAVISGLSIGGGDVAQMFETLKQGLSAPLSGMGTAFSTSLFGLAGSLILGFLDLQAGQAQNRFFNEVEDWLSGQTRLSGTLIGGEHEGTVPAYVQALLERTAESLESLERTLARGEDARQAANAGVTALTDRLGILAEQMRAEQALMRMLADGQAELRPVIARLAEGLAGLGIDEPTRGHIRNLDVYVARLIEETIAGREELLRQIRSDIKLLARTLAARGEGVPR